MTSSRLFVFTDINKFKIYSWLVFLRGSFPSQYKKSQRKFDIYNVRFITNPKQI